MPIYEYACKHCEHTLDALQKISDEPLVDCPECGKPALRKLVSAPRFRLKGAGWYETDFKKDNQRNVLKGDSEPAADKSEKKSDTKKDKKETSSTTAKSGD
jgi:putative FmdB family regulatory protein